MKINTINTINNIYFKSNSQPTVPRSQQQQQNLVSFTKENKIAEKADSIEANPITALWYKLRRTYGFLTREETAYPQQTLRYAA